GVGGAGRAAGTRGDRDGGGDWVERLLERLFARVDDVLGCLRVDPHAPRPLPESQPDALAKAAGPPAQPRQRGSVDLRRLGPRVEDETSRGHRESSGEGRRPETTA